MGRAWSFLAVDETNRQHGGNAGYDDDPERHYSWDSTVAHHRTPGVDDVAVLRDGLGVLGVSRIDAIEATPGVAKLRRRCPRCGSTAFKRRSSRQPLYRCGGCREEFDVPEDETIEVTAYRAEYSRGWVAADGAVTAHELESACLTRARQHAIRELDVGELFELLRSKYIFVRDKRKRSVAEPLIPGGRRRTSAWQRVGQDPFRRRLLERFGAACAISGPRPIESLHAAHLYGFSDNPRHDVAGGLLLRADLHRLFDADLIKIRPDLVVDVDPALRIYPDLRRYHQTSLGIDRNDPLLPRTLDYLRKRWEASAGAVQSA